MPLSFNLIASRRRCVCFWHINNQSLWSGIFVVQIYRGSLQIWFKIEQQSISVLWNLTVQHCKLYQNILNISWWRIVITNWNIGNDRVYFESMFASASFPSLVVGKWPCLLEIGSNPRVSCDDKQKLSMWEQFSYFLYTYLNIIDIYLIFQWRPTTSVSAKQSRDRLLGH